MKPTLAAALALFLSAFVALAAPTDDIYKLGPDSLPQPGVPQGTLHGPTTLPSKTAFPDTFRNYWVYVPAQYDPARPANLMVFQDGQAFVNPRGDYRIPTVLDNLIYRREIPVMIAVFVNPGRRADQQEATPQNWGDRGTNRPTEYNELNDKYATLIVDELLPVIRKTWNISDDPNDRGIGGASSGAIAAFTVAWHRPDQFRKVFSTIGSYTNIRGGHVYPDLIRQSDRKPIRIFLEDTLDDNRGVGRNRRGGGEPTYDPKWDWHAQNIKMVEALTEKGYDVNFAWGLGTHSNKHAGAITPEMLRWLWRDHPRHDNPKDPNNRGFLLPATRPTTAPAR